MYGRVTRVQMPVEAIDKGIANFKEKVVPAAKATPGNVGQVLLVDRKTGAGLGITLWDSAQALGASEQMGITSRTQSTAATGGSIVNVERFEQVISHRAGPMQAGYFARLNTISGNPSKIDNSIKFMEKQVLPVLQAQRGFRALIMNVDRMTGRSTVSTVWESLADLEASESKISSLRRDAADAAGAKDVTVEIFESAFTEIKQPATA
jgi:hypothetical protein